MSSDVDNQLQSRVNLMGNWGATPNRELTIVVEITLLCRMAEVKDSICIFHGDLDDVGDDIDFDKCQLCKKCGRCQTLTFSSEKDFPVIFSHHLD